MITLVLTTEEAQAVSAALANNIIDWQNADCGENQEENDKWVETMRAVHPRLAGEIDAQARTQ